MLRTLVLSSMLLLLLQPLSAQVKEVTAYRFDGGLEEVARRQSRLALPNCGSNVPCRPPSGWRRSARGNWHTNR